MASWTVAFVYKYYYVEETASTPQIRLRPADGETTQICPP